MGSLNRPLIFALLLLSVIAGCEESGGDNQIPFVFVDETINLNNFEFLDLKTLGGHVTINAGVRGIIIYRESNTVYRAFEKNCTYQPLDACADVEVDQSGLFLIDPCCSSKFNFDGFPFEGPATRPLLEYRSSVSGNTLRITNSN
ncbi:hypothetical protein QQ020_31120 [Fulvivirgaceae bacterium BMA12]|uniref:Rieske domain-containing protein n=1 Tax=Agaribacillus aureus TaxID=3051825 RepID=A0ABT8LFL5_9BACT|nr:hypothetical protein [Fulvivirgaceae bacterium BMA12]